MDRLEPLVGHNYADILGGFSMIFVFSPLPKCLSLYGYPGPSPLKGSVLAPTIVYLGIP